MEKKIFFRSLDGTRLCGILTTPRATTRRCIILCHGISMNMNEWRGEHRRFSNKLVEAGFATFRFDFRGHGQSGGKSVNITVSGETKDVDAAIAMVKRIGYKRIGVIGTSFAGGPVLFSVQKHQQSVKALVLSSALVDYHSLLNPRLPWPKKNFGKEKMQMLREKGYFTISGYRPFRLGPGLISELKKLEPWKMLKKLRMPVMFIHGDKDGFIPCTDAIKYSKLGKDSRLKIITGATHGFDDKKNFGIAQKIIVNFFKETV